MESGYTPGDEFPTKEDIRDGKYIIFTLGYCILDSRKTVCHPPPLFHLSLIYHWNVWVIHLKDKFLIGMWEIYLRKIKFLLECGKFI